MRPMASQITSLTIAYLFIQAQIKENIKGVRNWSLCSPHKGPVTRKRSTFDDVIMGTVDVTQASSSKTIAQLELCEYSRTYIAIYLKREFDIL